MRKDVYKDFERINKELSQITNSEKRKFINTIKNELGGDIKEFYSKPIEIKKPTLWDKFKMIFKW